MSRVFQPLGNGVPSTKNDFETLRFYTFAASRSRLAYAGHKLNYGIPAQLRSFIEVVPGSCTGLALSRILRIAPDARGIEGWTVTVNGSRMPRRLNVFLDRENSLQAFVESGNRLEILYFFRQDPATLIVLPIQFNLN